MELTPIRPPRHAAEFLIGLALGAIPLVIWLIFIGAAAVEAAPCRSGQIYCWLPGANQLRNGLTVYELLWLTQLIVTLVLLANGARRFLGYGLLVMLVVGPIVGAIACINTPNIARSLGDAHGHERVERVEIAMGPAPA